MASTNRQMCNSWKDPVPMEEAESRAPPLGNQRHDGKGAKEKPALGGEEGRRIKEEPCLCQTLALGSYSGA